jgi:zinc transport system substrate-binding protein
MGRAPLVGALVLALLVGAGCGADDSGDDGRPSVVAAFYPVAEVAEQVGGDDVAVTNLTPAGVEPHDLELTTDQVDAVLDADLVVYLGGGFSPALEEAVDGRDGPSLDLLDVVPTEPGAAEEGEDVDPHVWLDPARWQRAVDEVAAGVSDVVPDAAGAVTDRADRYRNELADLDAELESTLAGCQRDLLVTAHAAFHYLAERYGLRQEALTGVSPEAEPDPERLAELADLVEREGVTTVFTETLVDPEVAEALAREAGVDTAVLDPLEGLSDERRESGATYTSVMRDNGDALAEALGCR